MAERETPGQRIRNLREAAFITQKDFAERIGVAPSQLSRIESGETKTISSDILIAIATEFDVSTDYLLGLSTFQKPRNVDVTMTGLSEAAFNRMVNGEMDMDVLNRLIEHKRFPQLTKMIRPEEGASCWQDTPWWKLRAFETQAELLFSDTTDGLRALLGRMLAQGLESDAQLCEKLAALLREGREAEARELAEQADDSALLSALHTLTDYARAEFAAVRLSLPTTLAVHPQEGERVRAENHAKLQFWRSSVSKL